MKKLKSAYSDIVKAQCERTAYEYYAFRKKGGSANDLVEIPAMKKLIGNVCNKHVIDCGCGFGTYSIHCAKLGAKVTAIDISETMIQLARQEAVAAELKIDFRVQDVAFMDGIPSSAFDLAISSNAICFDMFQIFNEINIVLKPRGVLCFSEVHPMLAGDINGYFCTDRRKAKNVFGKLKPSDPDYEWQWQHYTLEDYFVGIKNAGFMIDEFLEPKPDPEQKDSNSELYSRAAKRPMFILIKAIKVNETA